jgi:hypothetical protein
MRNDFSRVVLLAVCVGLGGAHADVPTGTPTFSDPLEIDNTYHPFVTFRIRVYDDTRADAWAIDVFRPETRTFRFNGANVECGVMQEWAIEEGEVVEISKNYFAQADDGTAYYFGEVVDIYEDGEIVSHDGSWLVGGPKGGDPDETVEAEAPTVFVPANPEVGDVWKPEDLPEAGIEEFVEALGFGKLKVPEGTFHNVLHVEERTPDVEDKWYAPHVGFLKAKGGGEVLVLVDLIDAEDEEEMEDELEDVLDELLDEEWEVD